VGYSPDAATVQQLPGRNAYLDGLLGFSCSIQDGSCRLRTKGRPKPPL
jgi:hypothetical protein